MSEFFGYAKTVPRHITRFQFRHFEQSQFLKCWVLGSEINPIGRATRQCWRWDPDFVKMDAGNVGW